MPCLIDDAAALSDKGTTTPSANEVDDDCPDDGIRFNERPTGRRPFATFRAMVRGAAVSGAALATITGIALTGRSWLAARSDSLAVKPAESIATTVRVVELEAEVVARGLQYSAVVKELASAELSFRVGGTVAEVYRVSGPGGRKHPVHEGDRVSKGTELAWLDSADYRRERAAAGEKLAGAEARRAQLETELNLAQNELRRTSELVGRGAATDAELDTARSKQLSTAAALASVRCDVASARIALEQAEANLGYCTLVSPLDDATVAARFFDAGERVAPNQPAIVLLDLSSVVVAFGVPDTLIARLALGQVLDVTSDALRGRRFQGVVHKIASTADPQTRTYAVEVRIDEPNGLRPGMVATVAIEQEIRACLLPLGAIMPGASKKDYEVFRVSEEGGQTVVRRVPVEFDDVLDNRVTVKLGEEASLRPGDLIVAVGTHRLYDGQRVAIEDMTN